MKTCLVDPACRGQAGGDDGVMTVGWNGAGRTVLRPAPGQKIATGFAGEPDALVTFSGGAERKNS